jgi:DNA-binding NtrC family response regulator
MHNVWRDGIISAPCRDSIADGVNESVLERFLENMSDAGRLTLFRWARQHAPNLLYALTVSFLTQAPSSQLSQTMSQRSSSATSLDGPAMISEPSTLRAVEQQYIAQAIAESSTLREAALRLGVAGTTLWRKRKLYALRSEQNAATGGRRG